MSAAAPAPPPYFHPVNGDNGSRAGGSIGGPNDLPNNPQRPWRSFPPIKDLIAKAEERVQQNSRASIEKLLTLAEIALNQVNLYLDLNRLDQAYLDYVVAYGILIETVPRAKDLSSLDDRLNLKEKRRQLLKRITDNEGRFAEIRDMIKADNERTKHMNSNHGALSHQAPYPSERRPSSSSQARSPAKSKAQSEQTHQRYSYPTSSSQPRSNGNEIYFPHTLPSSESRVYGDRSYHDGRDIDQRQAERRNSSLSERFAKLRMNGGSAHSNNASTTSLNSDREPHLRASGEYAARRDTPSLHMDSTTTQRTLASNRVRPHVNTAVSDGLPKPPSPTYTPTKGTQDGVRFQPLRSTRSTNQNLYEAQSSIASPSSSARARSRQSGRHPYGHESEDLTTNRPRRRRGRSLHEPTETDVNADKLYDYLSTFNVLLVDIRPRNEFNAGHIFGRSVICVEPTALRQNMSAEELQEALVLSPEDEVRMFDHRDEYDLIVYYDQSSSVSDWGPHQQRRPNVALKYLNDALYDFNQEKPLRWPPILLNGGVDAWVDLLGNQVLLTSDTTSRSRTAPGISRRPVSGLSPRIDVQKRRHREYNPLDPEEEKKWRERARSESIVLDQRPHAENYEAADDVESGMVSMPDYEEFVNRFPDVADVEGQRQWSIPNHMVPVPEYPTPQPPTALPHSTAPQPPPHASHPTSIPPSVPARPAPAVPRRTYSGVSDRVSPPAVPAKPPKLAPYIPPRLKRLPRTGLRNFGVTCYMNATIQCLSATIPLTAYFLDGQFHRDIQRDNWKGSKGIMAELYHTLLRNLWESTDVETIRPTNFRKFNARLNKEWGLDRQQDAKEYLEFLIDGLHEDLNVNWHKTPLRPLTEADEAQRERTAPLVASKREWGRYEHRDHSRMTDYFAGQHLSRLQCNVCHHSSTTYEPFYSISVEIPNVSRRPIDIRDCLRSYCSAETLAGEEVWRCPRCRCEREATKRILITRVPENLVVHFKRFSASHSQSAKKITVPIEFPLEGLDLEPFVLPAPDMDTSNSIVRQYGTGELQTPGSMKPPYRYDCYAVMRHLGGTIASGHYIALVRDEARRTWREFNDDRVHDFHPEELSSSRRLQNEQAYIVFYSRVRG